MTGNIPFTTLATDGSEANIEVTVNSNNAALDNFLNRDLEYTISTSSPVTMSSGEMFGYGIFVLNPDSTAPPVAGFTFQVPALPRGSFTVINDTNQIVTVEIASQPKTSPTIAANSSSRLTSDGVNVRKP